MKPFYIARRTERRERADRYLLWIGGIVFAAGLIVSSVGPTTLRVVFYAGVASLGAYLAMTLARGAMEPVNYAWLRLSDAGIEYKGLPPEVSIAR